MNFAVDFFVSLGKQTFLEGETLPRRFPDMKWSILRKEDDIFISLSHSSPVESNPIFNQSRENNWTAWCIGEIFRYKDHKLTKPCLKAFLEDLSSNTESASSLNGHYLIFALEQDTKMFHVWTNRFGTLHAYHSTTATGTCLGTYSPALISANRSRLDWTGISGFFLNGFFPNDRTYIEGLRILKPATHYQYAGSGKLVKQERYWQWFYNPKKRTQLETISEINQIMNEIVSDQLSTGITAVPVSGGLDSRMLASHIRNGQDIWSYSYGYSEASAETRIAHQIAVKRDLPFQKFTIDNYLFDNLDYVVSSIEGFHDLTQARQASVVSKIGQNAQYVMTGHWGGSWFENFGDKPIEAEGHLPSVTSHFLKKVRKKGSEWLLQNIAVPTVKDDLETLIFEEISVPLNNLSHITCDDFKLKALKTDQWSARWTTASLRIFSPYAFPRLPFYDNRLTDYLCTVPIEFHDERELQIEYLKHTAPDLAEIEWQPYASNLYKYKQFHTWMVPIRALKKVRRVLSGQSSFQRNWEVQFLTSTGKAELQRLLLKQGLRLHDLVSPAQIKLLLNNFFANPDGTTGYTVCMLLTFSSWLEKYG
jgi:asparagine synthase (glutamine-hydrolysing)